MAIAGSTRLVEISRDRAFSLGEGAGLLISRESSTVDVFLLLLRRRGDPNLVGLPGSILRRRALCRNRQQARRTGSDHGLRNASIAAASPGERCRSEALINNAYQTLGRLAAPMKTVDDQFDDQYGYGEAAVQVASEPNRQAAPPRGSAPSPSCSA
jgi:hypothetical protein